jgi:biotin carboxyl carrier protein
MTFEIEVGGRVSTVSVEPVGVPGPGGGRFRLRMENGDRQTTHEVEARATDLGLSLLYAEDGRGVDVAVTGRHAGGMLLQLPHVTVNAVVDGRRFRRAGTAEVTGVGETRVLAPMPGRVLRVLVAPGDEVTARQGLVVVEAMKMENDIGAPRAGRVKEIAVAEGQAVESGRLLAVLE